MRVLCLRTLDVFGIRIRKSHTPAYHPQGLLRGSITLFCNSSAHTLTKNLSETTLTSRSVHLLDSNSLLYRYIPHMLMFGREPHALLFDSSLAFDSGSYQHYLRTKLADIQDLYS